MSMNLRFEQGRGHAGIWEKGYPEPWHWSRLGGDYFNERDFFHVHWEVYNAQSNYGVRLHVESSRYTADRILNDLKRDVVLALIAPDIRLAVHKKGYIYRAGIKASLADIRANKSTEAFRVLLNDKQRQSTHQQDIEAVHAVLGPIVDGVLGRFTARLQAQFP